MSEIGLFPLPLVLLPSEQVPLHIFEERYKELIGECLAEDREFGLVFADEEGLREVGTRAAVVEVLPTEFEDGRMNIIVEGRERFRLLRLTRGRSFQTAETVPLEDADDDPPLELVERARELFGRLSEITGSDVETPAADTPQLSYALAGRVHELATDLRLELLAEVSETARLERVCEVLGEAAVAVEQHRRIAERAAGNGKVDFGIGLDG
jgi:Lon protease-like protein